ncbi:hypothetical protein HQ865_18650 [Mucilaginibacter mali]|uniref:Uncharacterized protein n=1 Tax=Mucilaginibacter mali TaxID=2740462 RepID=A0A7D4UEG7_9SPHI|nr:hypothetical protein [Mucilaginibacter mali]QKJ31699.1 hypothetical protein HQ865_18650 [Mucilaginibacter mali]
MIRKYAHFAVIFILILSAIITKGNSPRVGGQQDSEDKIRGIVSALPEVKKYLKDNKELHPLVYFFKGPTTDLPYYWVKVGISSGDKFWPSHHFLIQPKTYKVFYRDMMANSMDPKNSIITLEQWRKYRSTPGYQKMHTYKNGKLVLMQ